MAGEIVAGLYAFQKMRKQLVSILEDPRCTPAERLECVRKIEKYKQEAIEYHKNKPSVKNKKVRRGPKVEQNTALLSNLLQKVEATQ